MADLRDDSNSRQVSGEFEEKEEERERDDLVHLLEDWLETPMALLGFVWLALLVADLTMGLGPILARISDVIWALFILDFGLKFVIAPRKRRFLRRNILTMVSLMLPALRALRLARAFQAVRAMRGIRLVRVVGTANRGMRSLSTSMGRRGIGYVLGLTIIVLLAGSAGIFTLEHRSEGGGFDTFGTALWWTAMVLTTMGSDYWPLTPEGRLLTVFLSLYAFAIFGYFTAALATFFLGHDAEAFHTGPAGFSQVESLREEIRMLREEITRDRGGRPGA